MLSRSGPIRPSLAADEVHVWWFDLDRDPLELAMLGRSLAKDERQRVARFHFQRDADHATAARGLLRRLLARYVGGEPGELQFDYGPQNKPRLSGQRIQFNLSHSRGLGVCAIAFDQPVGVDVEYVQADFDHVGMARHSFSAAEREVVGALCGAEAARAFFRCWTLKEAYIKARGGGLSIRLDIFDVPLSGAGADGVQPVISREPHPAAHGWFVRPLEPAPDFAAAVALRSPTWTVREWHLEAN